jgi:predicted dehydrogenase
MGVLADLGSHLLDTLYFILGEQRHDLVPYCCSKLENKSYDYVLFGSKSDLPKVHLEATLLSWKNDSSLDIIGTQGSIHTRNFCKWGPSSLTTRIRVLPSGAPHETTYNYPQGDPTWELEYNYFKELVKNPSLMIDRDIWINSALNGLYSTSLCGV